MTIEVFISHLSYLQIRVPDFLSKTINPSSTNNCIQLVILPWEASLEDGSGSEGLSTLCAEAVSHRVTFAADRALLQNISTTCTVTYLGFIHMVTVDAVIEDRLAIVH